MLVEFSRAFIGNLDPEVQERFAYKNAERLIQGLSPLRAGSAAFSGVAGPRLEISSFPLEQRTWEESNEFISPCGIIGHSRDTGHGHGGIDTPLNRNAPYTHSPSGAILSVEESSDGAGGFDVKLLIRGSAGEGWGFLYEHNQLEPGIDVGSTVK